MKTILILLLAGSANAGVPYWQAPGASTSTAYGTGYLSGSLKVYPSTTTAAASPAITVSGQARRLTLDRSSITFTNGGSIENANYILLNTAFTDGTAEGRIQWNANDGTPEVGMPGGNVNLQMGQEMLVRVRNNSGSTITNGSVVYLTTATSSRPTISLADADGAGISPMAFAVATEDILGSGGNTQGYVTAFGTVRDVNTSAWAEGTRLFLSTAPGQFTATIPAPPAKSVFVAYVTHSHATVGSIFVAPLATPSQIVASSVTATEFYGAGAGITGVIYSTAALQADINTRVLRAGDRMTGQLTLDNSTFTVRSGPTFVGVSADSGMVLKTESPSIQFINYNPDLSAYIQFSSGTGGSKFLYQSFDQPSGDYITSNGHYGFGVERYRLSHEGAHIFSSPMQANSSVTVTGLVASTSGFIGNLTGTASNNITKNPLYDGTQSVTVASATVMGAASIGGALTGAGNMTFTKTDAELNFIDPGASNARMRMAAFTGKLQVDTDLNNVDSNSTALFRIDAVERMKLTTTGAEFAGSSFSVGTSTLVVANGSTNMGAGTLFAGGGKVGVGTISPLFLLNVSGDRTYAANVVDNSAQMAITGNTAGSFSYKKMLLGYDTNGATGDGFGWIKTGNQGYAYTPLLINSDSGSGGVSIGYAISVATPPVNGLIVRGNIGIGNTNPDTKLHVSSGEFKSDGDLSAMAGWVTGASRGIYLRNATTATVSSGTVVTFNTQWPNAYGNIAFSTTAANSTDAIGTVFTVAGCAAGTLCQICTDGLCPARLITSAACANTNTLVVAGSEVGRAECTSSPSAGTHTQEIGQPMQFTAQNGHVIWIQAHRN